MTGRIDPKKIVAGVQDRGLAPKGFVTNMLPGAIFLVEDSAIDFPTSQLPSAGERKEHKTRHAIIMQAQAANRATTPKTLLVIPCSASGAGHPSYDYEIAPGHPAFSKDKVVAYVSLIQPILKSQLVQFLGHLDAKSLGEMRATLARIVAIADEPAVALPPRNAPAASEPQGETKTEAE